MAIKKDYIPKRDGDLDGWETNFKNKVAGHSTALGIVVADSTAIIQKVEDHQGTYTARVAAAASAKSATEANKIQKKNTIEDVRAYANRLKAAPGYTETIGDDLGIVGEEDTFDPTTSKPVLTLKLSGTNSVVSFTKPPQVDAVAIYCKRGTETAPEKIAIDFNSPYVDNRPNLVPGVAEERSYFGFYYEDSQEIGLQSDVVKISITK